MVFKKKSTQTTLIDSSPAHCVSLSSSPSPAASVLDVPGGSLSTISDESYSFNPKEYIDVPGYLDICCGRGKGNFNRPGNKLFQDTIKENAESYRNAKSKSSKSAIVTSLLKKLTEKGARFVKKDTDAGRWYVLSPSLAHEKTGHAIRDHWTQQRQQQKRAAATNRHEEEKNVSSPPLRPRIELRKHKSSSKKRLHRKSTSTNKTQKPTSRRPIKKHAKKGTTIIAGPPQQVETMVVENPHVVLVVDSLPKLGMRPFHDVEHGSISTISSCPDDDHDHLESLGLFEVSPSFGEHQYAFQQNGNTEEDDNLSYVVPTSGNLVWSQPHFLFADDANDAQSLVKQNVHASHQLEAMSSLVDDNKSDTMVAHTLMYNYASQSGLGQCMSNNDPSIMDACFLQQNLVHGFGSTNLVENNPFMPNPLVRLSPIFHLGFTESVMHP